MVVVWLWWYCGVVVCLFCCCCLFVVVVCCKHVRADEGHAPPEHDAIVLRVIYLQQIRHIAYSFTAE